MRLLFTLVFLATLAAAQTRTPLTGVWKRTGFQDSGPQARTEAATTPGFFIFTGKYYSTLRINDEYSRPEVDVSKASAAELLQLWQSVIAQTGTYEIRGTIVTMHPIAAKSPRAMHPDSFIKLSFKLDGDTLLLTEKSMSTLPTIANPLTFVLTRVE